MTAPLPPITPDDVPAEPGGFEDCGFIDVACQAAQAAESTLQGLSRDAAKSAAEAAQSAATQWVDTPTPIVASQAEDGSAVVDQTVAFIRDHLHWYTAYLAVIMIMMAGVMTAWQRRAEPARDLLPWIARFIGYGVLGAVVLGMLAAMSDAFSIWIIDQSTDDFAGGLVTMLALADLDDGLGGLGTPLAIIGIAGIAWFLSGIQVIVLYFRGAVLGVLAGVLPTAAAASYTVLGRSAFERIRNWGIAYLLYKPTAAIIYANGFMSAQSNNTGDPLVGAWQSIALMVLALVALPAIIKVINPLAASVAGGSGGAASGALMAAPTATAAFRSTRGGSSAAGGAGVPGARGPSATGTAGAAGAAGRAAPSAAPAAAAAGPAAAGVGAAVGAVRGTANTGVGSSPPPSSPPSSRS